MRRVLALLFTASLLLPGCGLYFGDDDDECEWGGGSGNDEGAPQYAEGIRNPETGLCEYLGNGGGGGTCDPTCGPCPLEQGFVEMPSWGLCESACTGLDEQTCLSTPGCRGGYIDDCPAGAPATCDQTWFYECWATDQMGPIQGSCDGLDAWSCSQHDDCIAVHNNGCAGGESNGAWCGIGGFKECRDEPAEETGCYGDADCGAGERCNAAEVCLPPPGCSGSSNSDEGAALVDCTVCYGACVPDDPPPACDAITTEVECIARADCTPLYEGQGCDCDPTTPSCGCQGWTFVSCTAMD